MENYVHTRYCCHSSLLWDKLIELGFVEEDSDYENKGLNQVRRFYKRNESGARELKVEDSYHHLMLFKYDLDPGMQLKAPGMKTWLLKYKGMSVNKELLEHFSKKGIYQF